MMRVVTKILSVLPLIFAAGAAEAATTVRQIDIASVVPHCDQKMGTLFVGTIACKASGCGQAASSDNSRMSQLLAFAAAANGQVQADLSHLGDGSTDALVTALKTTGCFTVQDRSAMEALKEAAQASGATFTPPPADWMVTGAITSVALQSKKSSVAGGLIPVVGAISNTKNTANLTIDVRVIDTKTTEIVSSQSFNATSERSNWGFGGAGFGGSGALIGGTSSTNSPELDSVANEAVINAANAITVALADKNIVTRPTPVEPKK